MRRHESEARLLRVYLGESDRERLQEGAWADVVEMDGDLSVTAVYVEGEPVPLGA